MKTFTFIKHIIQGAALALLCGFMSTACWEGFTDSFIAQQYKSVPPDLILGNSTLTALSVTLNWTEPGAPSYTGVKITCTGLDDQKVNKGTTTCTLNLSGSTEYTITMTALYNTGDEFVDAEFKVTPSAKQLRFIYTAGELAAAGTSTATLGYYYILMADIDLSEYTSWTPIGNASNNFTGIFDGNSRVIRSLRINTTSDYQGLFGYANGATIKNLGVTDVNISGKSHTGGLVGRNDSGTIENCHATGPVTGSANYTGGLVGYNSGTISNCHATGSVTGHTDTGGLVGNASSGTIENCYATGPVTGSSYHTGGLAGFNTGASISSSYATGIVSGNNETGGLVGRNTGIITNCHATGSVTGTGGSGSGYFTGGLVGFNTSPGEITLSYATGTVSGNNSTGGLVGDASSGTISNCYATGVVTGLDLTGGLAGHNTGASISSSYATGTVSGNNNTGGLVGEIDDGIIENCYTTGAVSGSEYYTGGLVGTYYEGTISYCYSTGKVTGTSNAGAFAGRYYTVTLTSCFYNSDTAEQSDTKATGKTDTDMKLQSTYQPGSNNWNFTTIWSIDTTKTINNGYPYLTGMEP